MAPTLTDVRWEARHLPCTTRSVPAVRNKMYTDRHPNILVRVLPVNEITDLVADIVVDWFDREVESGSPGSFLTDGAVSRVMDLVVIPMVVYTASSVSLASAGLFRALSWILLMAFLARSQRGMMSKNNGGSTISWLLRLPPVDQPRIEVPATARM